MNNHKQKQTNETQIILAIISIVLLILLISCLVFLVCYLFVIMFEDKGIEYEKLCTKICERKGYELVEVYGWDCKCIDEYGNIDYFKK